MGAILRVLLLVFVAGAAVMTAELAAPRLLAPHLGTSVLVWAVTISTFLGGIAVGNAWGGRLADRGRRATLPVLFLGAAASLALAVPLEAWLATSPVGSVAHGTRTLLLVPVAFGIPAVLLGAISPPLARAALSAGGRPGRTLGVVGAAGAAGSVLGTFLTGFLLVPSLGTRAVLWGTAAVLGVAAAGAVGLPASRREEAPRFPAEGRTPSWTRLAALAGASILVLEVAAGRVVADRIGNSVFTWTSVIGVVLLGIVVGNAVGGHLADRVAPRRLLGLVLLASSVAVASALWTPSLMPLVLGPEGLPWAARTLLAVALGFFLPTAVLGALTPAVIRAALADPDADGRIVGRLYAAGSAGAVVGAGVTGFWLVPWLGVQGLLLALAILLVLAAGRVRRTFETPLAGTLGLLLLLALAPFHLARELGGRLGLRNSSPGVVLARDSRYFRIRVQETDQRSVRLGGAPADRIRRDPLVVDQATWDDARGRLTWRGPMSLVQAARLRALVATAEDQDAVDVLHRRTFHRVRALMLDKLVHGYVDLDDPDWLGYEYEETYAALTRRLIPETGEFRAFFVGGGSYTFQRWLLRQADGRARITTAEIDPAVTAAAEEALGFRPDARHAVLHEDARTALDGLEGPFLLVYGDAFNDLAVPFHLTTVEFARALAARTLPEGAYLLNVVDSFSSGLFVGSVVCTLEEVFPEVALFSAAPRNDEAQETFVVAASRRPIRTEDLRDGAGRPLRVTSYGPGDLETLRLRAGRRVLTDDHAPVESLLAPVVERRGMR